MSDSSKLEPNIINVTKALTSHIPVSDILTCGKIVFEGNRDSGTDNRNNNSGIVYSEQLVIAVPRTINNINESWALGHLEDQLIIDLSGAKTVTVAYDPIVEHYPELKNDIRCQHIIFEDKYKEPARRFMRRIPVYKDGNPPEFIIYSSDISPRVLVELARLKADDRNRYNELVGKAIGRLCEEMDYEYYLRNAKGLPKGFRFVDDRRKENQGVGGR